MSETTFRNELFEDSKRGANIGLNGMPAPFNIVKLLSRCKTRKNNRNRTKIANASRKRNRLN
jgi:hypothetical protein